MTRPAGTAPPIIGVDLGATNVRAAVVREGILGKQVTARVPAQGTEDEVLETLYRVVDEVMPDDAAGVGVGVPSVVAAQTGVVYDVQNIPSWKEVPLKALLEARYSLPAVVNNDANCFALGEYHYGAGHGAHTFVGLILGTGFAGGIVSEGRLLAGAHCGAGEFGMLPYRDSIYEHYCSGQFFERHHGTTAAAAFTLARQGDTRALGLWETFGSHLGHALCAILYAADPDRIVLGGSVRHAYPFFRESMHAALHGFAYQRSVASLHITVSALENGGLLGAAALLLGPAAAPFSHHPEGAPAR